MKPIARTFYKMPATILFFTVVPVFYFLFVLIYHPLNLEEFLDTGRGYYTIYLIVSSLIVLGVMTLSRILLYLLRKVIDMNWSLYVLWCVGEAVACGLFLSIPMGIEWAGRMTYFTTMSMCVLSMIGILVFPISILSMAVQLHVLNKRADLAPVVDEKTLIRFYDEQQRLKLAVSSEAVLYIEAEENYVHIIYLDKGRVREFTLRSSMRALEETLQRHPMVRCHRSYYINPNHVELIRKDSNGYAMAQLDNDKVKEIPVSKRYYDSVTALL